MTETSVIGFFLVWLAADIKTAYLVLEQSRYSFLRMLKPGVFTPDARSTLQTVAHDTLE